MHKSTGVWLDHTRAYLVENCGGEETLAIVPALIEDHQRSTGDQHRAYPSGRRIANRRIEETKRYFQYLAKELTDAKDVFICGPGQMKKHFAKFLMQKPCNKDLAVEIDTTSSRLTLNQIRAKIRQHTEKAMAAG